MHSFTWSGHLDVKRLGLQRISQKCGSNENIVEIELGLRPGFDDHFAKFWLCFTDGDFIRRSVLRVGEPVVSVSTLFAVLCLVQSFS